MRQRKKWQFVDGMAASGWTEASKFKGLRTALPENFEACTQHSPIMPWLSSSTTSNTSSISIRLDEPRNQLPTIPAPRCVQFHSLKCSDCIATRRD
jgi:hypothetical protein